MDKSPSNLLGIKLITFNRADRLRKTLHAITSSPFGEFDIEVLDNCSTDNTEAVLTEFRERFSNLRVFRHASNVGLGANILRAYERFDTDYCWLIGDDDNFDFQNADLVISKLLERNFDIIAVSKVFSLSPVEGHHGSPVEFQRIGTRLYQTFSFLPSIIFRRKLLNQRTLLRCYRAMGCLWPHFPLIERAIEGDTQMFVPPSPIVLRNAPTDYQTTNIIGIHDFSVAAEFIEPAYRRRFLDDMLEVSILSRGTTAKRWAAEKRMAELRLWKLLHFFSLYRYQDPLRNLLAVGMYLVPTAIHKWIYVRIGGKRQREVISHAENERL